MATPSNTGFPKASPSQDPAPSPPQPSMRFRFKSKRRRSRSRSPSNNDDSDIFSRPRSSFRSPSQARRHHNRRNRRRHNYSHSHSHSHPNRRPETPPQLPPLSPNRAFRESLFDALADDEGAAFWENVYGQPIHTYSAFHPASDSPMGTLERMTDEEYANYVRGQMWERTHTFLAEERQRRKEKAEGDKERRKEEERNRRDWDIRMDEGLRRREERNSGKCKECWGRYLRGWEDGIVWPVESGRREDVSGEEVKRFFQHASLLKSPEGSRRQQSGDLGPLLKLERVRWHPDKVQQRFGGQGIDEVTMKAVTEVFQIVDRLWAEIR